jgi:hypothetical protein
MIPTNKSEPNTSKLKEQAAHENPMKIARKRHENRTSYMKEIDATMKASIHSEVRFFTKLVKNLNLWSKEMRSSPEGWFAWKP